MGAKKFDTSLETREIKLFGRDIPGFCRDIPEWPEKFEKKKFVFNFRSLEKSRIESQTGEIYLGGRFGYFFNFFCSGEGEGGVRGARKRGGGAVFIENPRKGLPGEGRGGWGRGARRVSAGNFGGGAKYFFRGRNSHRVNSHQRRATIFARQVDLQPGMRFLAGWAEN